ncbi:MAG TPA: HEAT repeat domain-containing protein [Gemmataceae bacterium]|nr:HEAT repeat domain-containing protein [Gemmataceae bacterium]
MLRWFAPKCPLDTLEKTWIEWRMRWLADQLGIDRLLQTRVLLPTEQDFPFLRGTDAKHLQRLLDHLCSHMGIDADKVSLEVLEDQQMPGAAGLYYRRKRSRISVARSQLAEPSRLLATLSHELAHEVLLGGGYLHAGYSDHEQITDLLTVFLGTGVFCANDTIRDSSGSSGTLSWWSISKSGYLPSRMYGYAFALFAFVRGEAKPAWAEHLRLDARAALEAGLRYLHKTGDSFFHPDTIRAKLPPLTPSRAIELLRTGTPTLRLATLWDIQQQGCTDPELLSAVHSCLDDRDSHILAGAARTLAIFGPAAEAAIPRLLDLLWRGEKAVKIGAAEALGAIQSRPERVLPELMVLLTEEDAEVIDAVADALRPFGRQAASAVPSLLAALRRALIQGEPVRSLTAALQALSDEPQQELRGYFNDPELLRLALEAL